ncbi:DUF5615 family PIN-like protein [Chitinophaga sp. MD30]|uniref:DUF5615 family PIN-like protein n=1 Tax=Chitinophaga sp. MD30 TaxID=2033437 RepID=UPI001CED6D7A|nr:DUF5615 family PIN-like protein [Chitinophaga sp. MD30]
MGSRYRYGFNGKENDDEVKGVGNQQDYGMRVYDPRVGKFLSIDPLTQQYPELTPYQFASNTPIWAIDIDGAEGGIPVSYSSIIPEIKEWWNASSKTGSDLAHGWYNAAGIPAQRKNYTNGDAVISFLAVSGKAYTEYRSGGLMSGGGANRNFRRAPQEPMVEVHVSSTPQMPKTAIKADVTRPLVRVTTVSGSESLDIPPMYNSRLRGRELIVDDNLSPKLMRPLEEAGFSVKRFPKVTLDEDIIKYAQQGNSIILTNNIKDFRGNNGVTAIKVTSKQQQNYQQIVPLMKSLDAKSQANPSILKPGKVVSLANPE